MRAIIIAGGAIGDPAFYKPIINDDDVIFCADSGYKNAEKMGIKPHIVIGDFDSAPQAEAPKDAEIRVLPVEKDRTDLHECIVVAMEQGAKEILLFGARGSRADHSLAAISLLKLGLDHGVLIHLIDEHNETFLIDREAIIEKRDGYKLSLLPMTKASGISAEGVYYPLQNGEMDWGNPYGVSNEFVAAEAKISVKEGILIAMISRD